MNALIHGIVLFWVGAACKLRLASYGLKTVFKDPRVLVCQLLGLRLRISGVAY